MKTTYENSTEVPAELVDYGAQALHPKNLAAYQEEDSYRSEVDHPDRDGHHSIRHAGEEIKKRFPFLSQLSKCDAENDRKEY